MLIEQLFLVEKKIYDCEKKSKIGNKVSSQEERERKHLSLKRLSHVTNYTNFYAGGFYNGYYRLINMNSY